MLFRPSLTVPLCGALLLVACGSKQKPGPTTAGTNTSGQTVKQDAKPTTERATGDLRDAMLHLRRVHFALDSDTLQPESRDALSEAASRLRSYPKVHIYIDGHTDDRGTAEYNVALGERRARVVQDYLTKLGIPAARLHVMSYGKEQPLAAGRDQRAYGTNRRAEFRLMRGDVRLVLDEGVVYNDKGRKL